MTYHHHIYRHHHHYNSNPASPSNPMNPIYHRHHRHSEENNAADTTLTTTVEAKPFEGCELTSNEVFGICSFVIVYTLLFLLLKKIILE